MNDFENTLLTYYNFNERIDRKTAKQKTISQYNRDHNENLKKYESLKFIWNDTFSDIKFKKKGKKENIQVKIGESSTLEDLLMDYNEGNNGYQITKIYKTFIKLQNDYLIAMKDKLNNSLKYLKSLSTQNLYTEIKIKEIEYHLERLSENYSIKIQNATENEILDLEKIDVENFNDFEILLCVFSKRKCLNSNMEINNNNYNEFIIDYENIESYLRKCFLYGKKIFKNELNFINYNLESSNDSFINQFFTKYGNTKLSKEKIDIFNNCDNINKILESCEQLINYINNYDFNKNEQIKNIINSIGDIGNLSSEFSNLINENDFKINELIGLFDLIIEKSFENIQQNYKTKNQKFEDSNYKNFINQNFLKGLEETKFVKLENLLRALRLFVIYFMNKVKLDQAQKLFDFIHKEQLLWLFKNNNEDNDEDEDEMETIKKDFIQINKVFSNQKSILIEDTISFYNVLTHKEPVAEPDNKVKEGVEEEEEDEDNQMRD